MKCEAAGGAGLPSHGFIPGRPPIQRGWRAVLLVVWMSTASGEPLGKAGSYAVQGRAAAFIVHISGSYSGIMGLPVFETAQLLRSSGFKI